MMTTHRPPAHLEVLARQWRRTWEHRCFICKRVLHLTDLAEGTATLTRIGGNSANGYEACCISHMNDPAFEDPRDAWVGE
jgi:hypothetical protein